MAISSAVIFISPRSLLPASCPDCEGPWEACGHATNGQSRNEIRLVCKEWHEHRQHVTSEEADMFAMANGSDELLSNPMWIAGQGRPVLLEPRLRKWSQPGQKFEMDGGCYEVVLIETDRVWVRDATDDV
jgi:hypothetical protein